MGGEATRLNFSDMPIPQEQITPLIKAAQTKRLPKWKREFYDKTCRQLQVHTKGQLFTKVDTLFPNEHPASKKHCINSYEPITKGSIWKGINNLSRIFSNSSFDVNVGDELHQWLRDYEHDGNNLVGYFLELWLHKAIAEDPNGLFVVYPPDWAEAHDMCPVQFVRSELIRSYGRLEDGTKYIAFVSEHDSEVEYKLETCATKRYVYWDETVNKHNAKSVTETTYNERLQVKIIKEVTHLLTADGLLVYKVQPNTTTVDFQVYNFEEPLSAPPYFYGGGVVADKADVPLYESFLGSFLPFGNLALLAHRNHQAVDLQFSYPRMSELETPCMSCTDGKKKVKKTTDHPLGLKDCEVCSGSGFVTHQSPYKSYLRKYDPTDAGNNEHLKAKPVEFYTPDVGIVTYSKEEWRDYLKMAEQAIFIMQKVYTGNVQSAESKNIDLDELYAWLLNISKTFYGNLRCLLQFMEEYISRSPVTVSVNKPYSFAILTEEEAFVALTGILASEAPIFIKGNRVDDFVSRFVSKNSPINKALAVLKQFDPLLYYSTKDIQTFKGANTITQQMWTNHILGYPVMLKLYEQDHTLFDQETGQIIEQVTAGIAEFEVPTSSSTLGESIRAILPNFNQTAPAA